MKQLASAALLLAFGAPFSRSTTTPPFAIKEAVQHSVSGYAWLLELSMDLAVKHDFEQQHRSKFVHGPTLRNLTEVLQEYTHLEPSAQRNVSLPLVANDEDHLTIEMNDVPVFHSAETATELFATLIDPDNAKYLADFSQAVARSFYGDPARGEVAASVWMYYSTLTLLLADPLLHSEDRNQDGHALVSKYRGLSASLAKEGRDLFAGLGRPFMSHAGMHIIVNRYPAQVEAYVAAFASAGSSPGLQPRHVGADTGYLLLAGQHGSVAAMSTLAAMYYTGDGVEVNHTASVEWYRRAARADDHDAQLALALLLCEKTPDDCSSAEALSNLYAAADSGHVEASYELASMLLPELDEAMPYYEHAAESGHARASYDLGRIYMEGQHGMRVNHTIGE
jgi:TPR repeat protein